MEVHIPSRAMAAALRRIAYPIDKPRGRPGVAVELEAQGTLLSLSTSDGEVFATEQLDCVVSSEGRVVCNFSVLRRLMEAAENSDAVLTAGAGTTSLQIELEHAAVQLPVLTEEDSAGRPAVPVSTATHLDAQTCALVRRVLTAASSDPGRPALCGVHFDSHGFAATDGHRLSVVDQDLDVQPSTVPGDLLAALLASFPNGCDLVTASTAATFTDSRSTWLVPLVAVPFPRYRHLIPGGESGSDIDVAAVGAALDRVAAVVGRTATVHLAAATLGELALTAEGAGLGRIHETVEVDGPWRGSGAFHVGYLADGFRCMDSSTAVASFEDDGPLKLAGRRMIHVLMPQRVA